MKIERWSSMQQYQQGSRLTYYTFDSISQPIEAPVEKAARDYLSRGRIIRPIYIRETRCDPSPSRMILARSDSLWPFISLDAFYCFSSREDCLAPDSNWVARSQPSTRFVAVLLSSFLFHRILRSSLVATSFIATLKRNLGFDARYKWHGKGRTEAEAMEHAVARAGHVATRFHGRHTTLSRSLALRRTFNEPAGERNTRGCVPFPWNDICSVELRGTRTTVCIMSDRDVL